MTGTPQLPPIVAVIVVVVWVAALAVIFYETIFRRKP
jgi:hypothetical protein